MSKNEGLYWCGQCWGWRSGRLVVFSHLGVREKVRFCHECNCRLGYKEKGDGDEITGS